MGQQRTIRRSHAEHRRLRRRKRAGITAVGALLILAVVIGTGVLLFYAGKSAVQYIKGPEESNAFFEKYIEPVVVEDPKPFSNIKKVDSNWALMTAIWVALNEDENSGRYGYTEDNRTILPVEDIRKSFETYFGDLIQPQYHTFISGKATFEYDAKENCFYIPAIALSNVYLPKVAKVERNQKTVKLTVEYIPGSGWSSDENGKVIKPAPAKVMYYTLSGSRGKYALLSIENVPDSVQKATASMASSSQKSQSAKGKS
ncbi:MAG TPA: hypothetical protein VHR42_01390 [Clostridia bacterium]|nr:hypothetical protein [Clostridia bacterium]